MVHIKNNEICTYIFFNLFFTSRHIFYVCYLYLLVLFLHLKEEKYWINLLSTHVQHTTFQIKTNFNKSVTRLAFSKNIMYLAFLKTWLSSCSDSKQAIKKECQFRILLVFGAAKLMNSCNLVLGRWYKTNTLEIHIHILGVRYFTCSCFYRLLVPSCS